MLIVVDTVGVVSMIMEVTLLPVVSGAIAFVVAAIIVEAGSASLVVVEVRDMLLSVVDAPVGVVGVVALFVVQVLIPVALVSVNDVAVVVLLNVDVIVDVITSLVAVVM